MKTRSSSIIIADLQPSNLGGHFAAWLNISVREGLKHFDMISVYVADAFSIPKLSDLSIADQSRVSIYQIPPIHRRKMWCGDILGVISRHHSSQNRDKSIAPIFLMWAQQYIERDLIYPPYKSWIPWRRQERFDLPWGSLTSVSSVAHQSKKLPQMEIRIHEEVMTNPYCQAVFTWDEYAANKYSAKYIYLPNVEALESDETWMMPMNSRITLGTVGQLWGYRSMNLMAEISSSEPDIICYVGGVLKYDSYSPDTIKMLKRVDGTFILEEGYVDDDSILNQRIRKIDAFVIDSRSYKCPSGLAIRAMAMGRPLVTIDSPSWIASKIREEGVGVFWVKSNKALADDLRKWYASGGYKRSINSAHKLSDKTKLEVAYTEMFTRLRLNADRK